MGVLGGGWTMESGGGQGRGGWIKESVNLVSVGGWVCVCVGVLSVGLGPGLYSMSPARSRRSASHAAGTHGWLPQKTGRPGLRRDGVGGYNLHSVPPNSPPDCGTPTTSRLYPFGANDSSSSCYQTAVFHCSTHCFTVSLNCRRSSKEEECPRNGHSHICLVFSDEIPRSHVVSPS